MLLFWSFVNFLMYKIMFIMLFLSYSWFSICFKLFTSYYKFYSTFSSRDYINRMLYCFPETIFAFKCSTLSNYVYGPSQLAYFSLIFMMSLIFVIKVVIWLIQNLISFSVSSQSGMSYIFSSTMFSLEDVIHATPL